MNFLFHFDKDKRNLFYFVCMFLTSVKLAIANVEQSTGTCDMSCDKSHALVLYDENKLSPFVKPLNNRLARVICLAIKVMPLFCMTKTNCHHSRTFHFVNTELVISQDWSNLGVAAVVWDAALVLCEYIEQIKEEFVGRNVIELGAGSGIVGIVAALLGANVVITDRETVFPYMRKVAKDNLKGRENIHYSVKVLDWTRDLHKFQQKYDIILGADIIYVEEIFDALLETLLHLSHKETKLYISCKIRYDRDTKFLDMMKDHFTLEEVLHERERDIKVFLCQPIK